MKNLFHVAGLSAVLAVSQCGGDPTGPLGPPRPPTSVGHALVFHDSLNAVLLLNTGLGGMTSPPSTTRTVIWRWADARWVPVDSAGPPIRNLGGVAYDIARNVVVLYGGTYDQSLSYDDTWEWRVDGGWQDRGVAGPGRRDHTDMVYDAERRQVVLFGGQARPDSFPRDTWTWDGTSWTRHDAPGPAARVHHSLLYDPERKQVLLFGGYAAGQGTDLGDTWAWNGTGWQPAAPAVAPRTHARLARSSAGVLVFGGMHGGPANAVLSLGAAGWQTVSQSNAPLPRYLPALAFDPVRGVLVLFGGGDPAGDRLYDDTWEYDGSAWRVRP